MNIGIIGAGNVGATLGQGLAKAGHSIVYGVRSPGDDKYSGLGQVRTVREAVEFGDAVILATPWSAAESALAAAGDFAQKPLLDATNPIGPGLKLTHGHTDSGAEQVARWAQNARVVKVFNTTGAENMADPAYGDARAAMFVCGDDDAACAVAAELARDLGFEVLRAGSLDKARILEPVALLWINLAMVMGHGRNIALGILRR